VVHDNTRTTDRSQYIITRTKGCLGVYQVWNGRSSCRATLHLSAEAARSGLPERTPDVVSTITIVPMMGLTVISESYFKRSLGFGSGGSPPRLCQMELGE